MPVTTRLLALITSIATVSGCGGPPVTPISVDSAVGSNFDPYTVVNLEAAPTRIMLGGRYVILATALRNQVALDAPSPTEGATPVSGRVWVLGANAEAGYPLPTSVSVLAVWLIRSGTAWQVPSFAENRDEFLGLAVDMPAGPMWGPASTVDVVALLSDGVASGLVRVASQAIAVIYSPVTPLESAPEVVTLGGTAITLSCALNMPISQSGPPPSWYPFSGGIKIKTVDGSPLPAGLTITRSWIVSGDVAWAPANPVLFSDGPRWGVYKFDIVVSVTDGFQTAMLRAVGQKVFIVSYI